MKTVVVHRGARDAYQVARSLQDAGLLDKLVTDLYWPAESTRARTAGALLPSKLTDALKKRYADGLDSANVEARTLSGAGFVCARKAPRALRSQTNDRTPHRHFPGASRAKPGPPERVGAVELQLLRARGIRQKGSRRKLRRNTNSFPASPASGEASAASSPPNCRSIRIALRPYRRNGNSRSPSQTSTGSRPRASLADHCLCASSFTRQTLVENGVDRNRIHVIPYGVDSAPVFSRRAAPNHVRTAQVAVRRNHQPAEGHQVSSRSPSPARRRQT